MVPSEAAERPIAKRKIALPPTNAESGIPFGSEDLRDAPVVTRLRMTSELADLNRQTMLLQIAALQKRLAVATNPDSQQKLRERIVVIEQKAAGEQQRRDEADAKLAALKAGQPAPKAAPKAPKAPKAKPAKEKKPKAEKPKAERPKAEKPKAEKKPDAAPSPAAAKPGADFDLAAAEDLIVSLFDDSKKDGK